MSRLIFFYSIGLVTLIFSACGTGSTPNAGNFHSPIPMENMVIVEINRSTSLPQIIANLAEYQSAGFNSLCVALPASYNPTQLKTVADSCHARGLNLILHADKSDDVQTKEIIAYDVDGWHCTNHASKPAAFWQQKIDSLQSMKLVALIAQHESEAVKEAGFASAFGNNYAETVRAVFESNQPVALIDSVLRGEVYFFTSYFPAVRDASAIVDTANDKLEEAAMLALCAVPGVPYVSETRFRAREDFVRRMLAMYLNYPELEYGECKAYNTGSQDVLGLMRDFKGQRLLIAINMRNRPASYVWPDGLAGIKNSWVFGEVLARNGGQELPAYGYQILKFENIVGVLPLEMDDK